MIDVDSRTTIVISLCLETFKVSTPSHVLFERLVVKVSTSVKLTE